MIGFFIYGLDPDDGNYWITTFMIDEKYQGNGYAKQAMDVFLDYFKEKYGADQIKLGHRPDKIEVFLETFLRGVFRNVFAKPIF